MSAPASSTPRERYLAAEARHSEAAAGLRVRSRRLAAARVVTFGSALLAGVLVFDLPTRFAVTWSFVAGMMLVFVGLVARHRGVRAELRRAEIGVRVAREGLARLDRDFDRLAALREEAGVTLPELTTSRRPDPEHPWAEDLDLWGPRGVRALMGPTPTPTGRRTLRRWIEAPPADPGELPARQAAVRELASNFERRERLDIEAGGIEPVPSATWDRFLAWLDEAPVFGADGSIVRGAVLPAWLPVVARVLPPVTLTLAAGTLAGWFPLPNLVWGIPLLVQILIAGRAHGALTPSLLRLGLGAEGVRRFHPLFDAWADAGGDAAWLTARTSELEGAGPAIRDLEGGLDRAESRASIFHPIFAVAVLADVRLGARLDAWRARHGASVEAWFERLGELEAAAALGALAHDHPGWAFPEIDPVGGTPEFDAAGLGHPLLAPDVRRTNDLVLDPPGRFLLVTGSNMSGKSTLLRSIGLAVVLGNAGGPVCASRCRMTVLRPFTSMRLADSIESGVSLFMAELRRLKALVDAAPAPGDPGPALLYLVDEVLQGTNSEERRIAARRIITHLLGRRAIGAVTTHDLALHEEPGLAAAATLVHFRETVGGEGEPMLTFDYRLREGLATSRNALRLLRMVGLDGDDREPGPTGPAGGSDAGTGDLSE